MVYKMSVYYRATMCITLMLLLLNLCEKGYGVNLRDMQVPCEEVYMVKEGETLNSISEKCGDPFIIEENPHINDPDDVFPGLIIKITPFRLYSYKF
ncbi:hypothetical protein RND81_06G199200 [Saponaria officinalis]|uniref:LysM domain-containing protein n=1 Tax=Saponaria officinalis TaxID=3572 RepID=A0AAW1KC31_SAPOF